MSVRGTAPLVYVYDMLDASLEALLAERSSRKFFDPWDPHNQFLSEWAFHRSLLSSSLVTSDPKLASFFFVPFYARIAYSSKRSHRALLNELQRALHASPYYQRSAGRDHMFVISSGRSMQQLFRDALPLVSSSILLKVKP